MSHIPYDMLLIGEFITFYSQKQTDFEQLLFCGQGNGLALIMRAGRKFILRVFEKKISCKKGMKVKRIGFCGSSWRWDRFAKFLVLHGYLLSFYSKIKEIMQLNHLTALRHFVTYIMILSFFN